MYAISMYSGKSLVTVNLLIHYPNTLIKAAPSSFQIVVTLFRSLCTYCHSKATPREERNIYMERRVHYGNSHSEPKNSLALGFSDVTIISVKASLTLPLPESHDII